MKRLSELNSDDYYRYRRTIRSVARRYSRQGHYQLDLEELEGEGWVVFASCRGQYAEHEFDRVFHTSLRNRYIHLWRQVVRQKRQGITIDLSEIYAAWGPDQVDSVYLRERLNDALDLLSPRAETLLRELIDPSEEVWDEIVRSHIRSKHLVSRQVISRARPLRVTAANLMKVLGLSKRDFESLMTEISTAVFGKKVAYVEG